MTTGCRKFPPRDKNMAAEEEIIGEEAEKVDEIGIAKYFSDYALQEFESIPLSAIKEALPRIFLITMENILEERGVVMDKIANKKTEKIIIKKELEPENTPPFNNSIREIVEKGFSY